MENGVFVFDEDWDEVYRKRSDLNLRWPELTPSGYPVADSLRNSHLVFQLAFRGAVRHVPSGWRGAGQEEEGVDRDVSGGAWHVATVGHSCRWL